MPIQLDSASSQIQTAISNPFQQRQDQVRDAARKDDADKTRTKPAQTAAAQSQPSESRNANIVKFAGGNTSRDGSADRNAPRGSLVDISA